MTWNFRIIKAEDGTLGIHEVYYNDKGKPQGYTAEPFLTGENKKDLLEELTMMKKDCQKLEILSFRDFKKIRKSKKLPAS